MGCCASATKADELSQTIEELETRVEADTKTLAGLRVREIELTKTMMTSKTMCGTLLDKVRVLEAAAEATAATVDDLSSRLNRVTCERDEAARERDEAARERDEAARERDEAARERDEATRDAETCRESLASERATHTAICKAIRDEAAHAAARADAERGTTNTRIRVMDTTIRRLVTKLKRERRQGRVRVGKARAYRNHMCNLYHSGEALGDLTRRICPTAMPLTVRMRYQTFGRALLGAIAAEVKVLQSRDGASQPPSPSPSDGRRSDRRNRSDRSDDDDGDGDGDDDDDDEDDHMGSVEGVAAWFASLFDES
jgi:hypothetical protein